VPFGSEPIRINNEIVGRIKSGGQGYTIGKAIAYAYLPIENSDPGTQVDVELFGTWVSGAIHEEPLFDPNNDRIRA
jgi:4-methylaminobutanoate oxidase (formaldehyde-forming)